MMMMMMMMMMMTNVPTSKQEAQLLL